MHNLLEKFLSSVDSASPSLEFDMFFWLTNSERLHAMQIYGRWIQADSPREIEAVLSLA
jgi:hypothetical protein